MCFLPREQTLFSARAPTPNISTQVLNMPEETYHLGFSCSESGLLPTPTTLKPLTWKAQWQPDLRSCSAGLHCEPLGLYCKVCSRAVCLSIWATDWAEKVRDMFSWQDICWTLEASVFRGSSHPYNCSAHALLGDRAVHVCLSGSLPLNAGCLATKSSLSPTLILRLWLRHFWSPAFPYPLSPSFPGNTGGSKLCIMWLF